MILDCLSQDDYLPVKRTIQRIASGFRIVSIDRCRADAAINRRIKLLIELNAPDLFVERVSKLRGRIAWVTCSDDDNNVDGIGFLVRPNECLVIGYNSDALRKRNQSVLVKLAKLLGYHIK